MLKLGGLAADSELLAAKAVLAALRAESGATARGSVLRGVCGVCGARARGVLPGDPGSSAVLIIAGCTSKAGPATQKLVSRRALTTR